MTSDFSSLTFIRTRDCYFHIILIRFTISTYKSRNDWIYRRVFKNPDSRTIIETCKFVAGDNEISHLSENDDRLLTELLKEVKTNNQLLGTGYDDRMLANLLVVTRPLSEIKNINEAAHWVGMPEYEEAGDGKLRLLISFPDENAREEFVQKCELRIDMKREKIWTTRYPWTERNDKASLAYVNENEITPPLSDLHPQ